MDDLFENSDAVEVEVPLSLLLALAECRGRMCAMCDYAKAHKYNFSSNDLSIIGGFEPEEKASAQV